MLHTRIIFITGLPGVGKSMLSKSLLFKLLENRRKSLYIDVGSLSLSLGLVTEYDFIHDTYTIEYDAVKNKIMDIINNFTREIDANYKEVYIIIETHDFCFLNYVAKFISPSKILVIIPSDKHSYFHFLVKKGWPHAKIRENMEYYVSDMMENDPCYIDLIREYGKTLFCKCTLATALQKLDNLLSII